MTIPSERQERDLKAVEAEIANWHRVIGRFGSSTDVERRQLKKLEAERDRSGGECAHSTDDGRCLFATRDWSEGCKPRRCPDCPGDTAPSAPAEPNPPGSGEPVAWQYRFNGCEDKWRELPGEFREYIISKPERYEIRPLYAAPLPSPSEGAGEALKEALRECEYEAARWSDSASTPAHRCADRIQKLIDNLRTRATATGGGDNG